MNTEQRIQQQLSENPIILYMKGVPDNPECGFSAKAVAALKATGIPFTFVNVLQAPFIREKLPKISKWPTYPQLFIQGELVGGSDIIEAMAAEGSLLPALQTAVPDRSDSQSTGTISHAEVERLIKQAYPDAGVYVEGEGCDLLITVISGQFAGESMVKQQQGVMAALTEPLGSGRLHAVTIKAYTPEQWQDLQAATGTDKGLLQIQV
ncbi:MAG: Grx4 family monothiol glutaredoxin [Gammaproteobacteria bacterium]